MAHVAERADRSEELRRRMVGEQVAARGVRDARVLAAMRAVPREPDTYPFGL